MSAPPVGLLTGSLADHVARLWQVARLWRRELDPTAAAAPPAAPEVARELPWPLAMDKVKLHGPAVERKVDAWLRASAVPTPQWRVAATSQPPGERARERAPSYLTLEGGGRLLMTPTLTKGYYGKFRLGLWESPEHPSGGQVVALKELRLSHWYNFVDDPARRRRTQVTLSDRAQAEVGHLMAAYSPLPVHGVVEHRGKLFISMPLMGDDLLTVYEKISTRGANPLLLTLGLHIAYDGAAALMPMHAAGLVHRDVKPDNLLHGPGNRIYLADLGMTEAVDPGSGTVGGELGTPGYMAPEVVRQRQAGPASDTWSLMVSAVNVALGILLFEPGPRLDDDTGISMIEDYERFHRSLERDADGRVQIGDATAATRGEFWADTFRKLARFDVDFADFVLNRGLHPDPSRRADAATIQAVVGDLLARRGIDPAEGALGLQLAGAGPRPHAQARAQLLAFARALGVPTPR